MYIIIWEFQPKRGFEKEFQAAYNADGVWAQFFKKGKGFVRTELFRDTSSETRFLTMDYWSSQETYEAFRAQHVSQYQVIDKQCESLIVRETHIGSFTINPK